MSFLIIYEKRKPKEKKKKKAVIFKFLILTPNFDFIHQSRDSFSSRKQI